ncbi:hypothetical protein DFH08DRAFT_975129 [Mycena albidolilacea]|uniref:Uncharacterized protein n=1 Tax=Mycena albidolilacea TaxID=1033008 RepID=A0AAD7EAT6_9AGAR|nr:hypothetical protein DFH08DRAFT_975129 [Mycena albidolilacea]
MLTLLILVHAHLFFKNGRGAPVPSINILEPRTSINSCDDINNCRRLFDVVWGCLATIFACTWVSVHPNVPPPGQTWLALLWRRLKMMLIAFIAPELMVGFAGRQFYVARRLSKEFAVSRTHGYLFCMGGFASSTGYPVATKQQLEDPVLGPGFLAAIRDVDAEDIMDKSKGDALSKGLALAQGLWFTAQCLARVQQHLAITALEAATLAFAVVNVFIWLLWWGKPLDVQRPIVVGPPKTGVGVQPISSSRIAAVPLKRLDRFLGPITGLYAEFDPLSSPSVPSFWALGAINETNNTGSLIAEGMVGIVFGAIHCIAWNSSFPTAEEKWMWRSCALVVAAIPAAILVLFVVNEAVYRVFSSDGKPKPEEEGDDTDRAVMTGGDSDVRLSLLREPESLSESPSAVFHASSTALSITGIRKYVSTTFIRIFYTSIPIYILARLFLTTLPFTGLRALPPGAYADVDWSLYIPHL